MKLTTLLFAIAFAASASAQTTGGGSAATAGASAGGAAAVSSGQGAANTGTSPGAGDVSAADPASSLPSRQDTPRPGFDAGSNPPGFAGPSLNLGRLGLTVTNRWGTNVSASDLQARLASLQAEVLAILPQLAAFNEGFPLTSSGAAVTGTAVSGVSATGGIPLTNTPNPRNFGNFGANAGANSGVNSAVPTRPDVRMPPGTGTPILDAASLGTFRGLVILQADLERMLPLLAAFTGNSDGAVPGIGAFSTRSATPGTTTPTGNPPPWGSRTGTQLTPTGR